MKYSITDYTKTKAKELGVVVKPSTNKKKKIDVFQKGEKIASVGANGMNDYPTWLQLKGKAYADERRRLYKIRHQNDRFSGNGKWADKLLW